MSYLPDYSLEDITLKDLVFCAIYTFAIQAGILFREWLRYLAEMDSISSWEYFWKLIRKFLPNKNDDWF